MDKIKISAVVPVFNEEKNVYELYTRLKNTLHKIAAEHELIFIDDGSQDASLNKIKALAADDKQVKYISFSRNFGHQVAVSAGLDRAAGEAVVIIDADLQDPPELIAQLYQKYQEGFKVVYAKRTSRKGESAFKKYTALLFYRVLRKITAIEIPVDVGDYRLVDHKIVAHLKQMPEYHKFLRGQISWIGFKQTFVEFERQERKYGNTGYSFRKMVRFALDGITSFSNAPLKLASLAGLVVSLFSFLVILYALYSKFILKEVIAGWTSLIISSMFIGGIQLLSIGIIGEYISRIYMDVKKRPLYIIDETNCEE
jgi:polyisoprenyl-phosphate glycosyltransferase